MDSLEKLIGMTTDLPAIPKLEDLIEFSEEGYIEYEVEGGHSFGLMLLDKKSVSVMRLFVSVGAKFPEHVHQKEKEWGIVFRGKIEFCCNDTGKKTILETGDSVEIPKGQNHSGIALEDTWMITVAVPRIEGYPTT